MNHEECGSLFAASLSLLEGSGLVRYSDGSFVGNVDEESVEASWKENFNQGYGRYMAWVWFSVGAENLVKAALICNCLLKAKKRNDRYPVYWPGTDKATWVNEMLDYPRNAGGGYGELGCIWRYKLGEFSEKREHTEAERNELKAAYKYLTQAIRNRDAHSYVANQRRKDFPAVDAIFVPAFNTLVRAMNDKGHFGPLLSDEGSP